MFGNFCLDLGQILENLPKVVWKIAKKNRYVFKNLKRKIQGRFEIHKTSLLVFKIFFNTRR